MLWNVRIAFRTVAASLYGLFCKQDRIIHAALVLQLSRFCHVSVSLDYFTTFSTAALVEPTTSITPTLRVYRCRVSMIMIGIQFPSLAPSLL